MATEITKYLDSAGKEWPTAVEADASDAKIANQAAVEKFIGENYSQTTTNGRKSPAARVAANAIYKWLGSQNAAFSLEA
jgi:hypothetical protein